MAENINKSNYIPEIIEAEDSDGQQSWYFALIYADLHKEYEVARDLGSVHIKKNDKEELFVIVNDKKLGQVVDNGYGAPLQEQKDIFIRDHGIPVHHKAIKDIACHNDNNSIIKPGQITGLKFNR